LIRRVLRDDPFTTLQLVLEPKESAAASIERSMGVETAAALLSACGEQPTYLDKFYAMHPGRAAGGKRLIVLLPFGLRGQLAADWLERLSEIATLVWRGGNNAELAVNEFSRAD